MRGPMSIGDDESGASGRHGSWLATLWSIFIALIGLAMIIEVPASARAGNGLSAILFGIAFLLLATVTLPASAGRLTKSLGLCLWVAAMIAIAGGVVSRVLEQFGAGRGTLAVLTFAIGCLCLFGLPLLLVSRSSKAAGRHRSEHRPIRRHG